MAIDNSSKDEFFNLRKNHFSFIEAGSGDDTIFVPGNRNDYAVTFVNDYTYGHGVKLRAIEPSDNKVREAFIRNGEKLSFYDVAMDIACPLDAGEETSGEYVHRFRDSVAVSVDNDFLV